MCVSYTHVCICASNNGGDARQRGQAHEYPHCLAGQTKPKFKSCWDFDVQGQDFQALRWVVKLNFPHLGPGFLLLNRDSF